MFGRVPSPFSHLQASLRGKRAFDIDIMFYSNNFIEKKKAYKKHMQNPHVLLSSFRNRYFFVLAALVVSVVVFAEVLTFFDEVPDVLDEALVA